MITKQQADEALKKIHRNDLTDKDQSTAILELCVEIANLKQLLQIRKDMCEDLQDENADLHRKLLFGE